MKTKCEYCKGYTKDDEKGNCSACGAPRQEKKGFRIPMDTTYGTVVTPSHLVKVYVAGSLEPMTYISSS